MGDNNNSPQVWNKLLDNDDYLLDCGLVTQRRISLARKWIGKSIDILNIGSGQGYLESSNNQLISNRIYNWTSLDISEVGLVRIKKRIPAVECVRGSILNLPFKNRVFDLIICMEVIEHISKYFSNTAYREMLRVGSNSAKYIFSVPVYEPVTLIKHSVGHKRKYTSEIISNEVLNNGFDIIQKEYLYAFSSQYFVKSLMNKYIKLRRPNVIMLLCQKS
jgi:SAM-dependent methyltransferase